MNTHIPNNDSTFSIWPITLSITAILMAITVFTVTQSVKQYEGRVRNLNNQILGEQQTMRILDAEWAYLTRPQRLEELIALKTAEKELITTPLLSTTPQTQTTTTEKKPEIKAKAEAEPKPLPAPEKKAEKPAIKIDTIKTDAPKIEPASGVIKAPETPATPAKKTTPEQTKKNDDLIWSPKKKPAVKKETVKSKTAPTPKPPLLPRQGGIARPILD